ncbi:hypothetical protein Tco_1507217 [Tanacetum coccineum]
MTPKSVFLLGSYLDGQPITGIDIANMILDQSFAQLYDDDAVGLCCLGILQLVILGMQTSNVGRLCMSKSLQIKMMRKSIQSLDILGHSRYFDHYNWYPKVAAWSEKKGRFLGHMVIPFFEENMPVARLTPDDNEARSDW